MPDRNPDLDPKLMPKPDPEIRLSRTWIQKKIIPHNTGTDCGRGWVFPLSEQNAHMLLPICSNSPYFLPKVEFCCI